MERRKDLFGLTCTGDQASAQIPSSFIEKTQGNDKKTYSLIRHPLCTVSYM